MGVCSCTSKLGIIIINVIFWIGAALMLYAGVSYLNKVDGLADKVNHEPAYIIFGAAGVLFLCGLFGIIGAVSEKKFLLGMFAVVVLSSVVLLVFVTTAMFVNHDNFMNETDKFVVKQFNNYGSPNLTISFDTMATVTTTSPSSGSGNTTSTTPDTNTTTPDTTTTVSTTAPTTTPAPTPDMNATKFIDSVQKDLQCCGFEHYTDWNTFDYWTNTEKHKGLVPWSCCNTTAADARNMTCPSSGTLSIKGNLTLISTDPCKNEVDTIVNMAYNLLNYFSLTFAILMFLGFVASVYLSCRKRSSDGFNYSSIVA